jgi:alginate O-acetyltransferase complex protein AlgI
MGGTKVLRTFEVLQVSMITLAMLFIHWFMRNRDLHTVVHAMPVWISGILWGAMAWLIIIAQGQSNAFIYFQF